MEHPLMYEPDDPWYLTVRGLALALPGAQEKVSHGRPTFYTRKVFAYYGGSLKVDGVWVRHSQSVVVLADLDGQLALRAEPGAYVPGYLGPSGWTGLDLDEHTELDALADWIETSYAFTAPRSIGRTTSRPAALTQPRLVPDPVARAAPTSSASTSSASTGWADNRALLGLLTGGNPRTLAGVPDALAALRADASRLPELIDCCSAADAVVRLRATDALEKFASERPELVAAHVDRLDAELSASSQPSVQWHLAQLWGEVPLTPTQRDRAAGWLIRTLDEADDWIVLTSSMSALSVLAADDPSLRPALKKRLQRHARSRLPSVAKRATRLLAGLD